MFKVEPRVAGGDGHAPRRSGGRHGDVGPIDGKAAGAAARARPRARARGGRQPKPVRHARAGAAGGEARGCWWGLQQRRQRRQRPALVRRRRHEQRGRRGPPAGRRFLQRAPGAACAAVPRAGSRCEARRRDQHPRHSGSGGGCWGRCHRRLRCLACCPACLEPRRKAHDGTGHADGGGARGRRQQPAPGAASLAAVGRRRCCLRAARAVHVRGCRHRQQFDADGADNAGDADGTGRE